MIHHVHLITQVKRGMSVPVFLIAIHVDVVITAVTILIARLTATNVAYRGVIFITKMPNLSDGILDSLYIAL